MMGAGIEAATPELGVIVVRSAVGPERDRIVAHAREHLDVRRVYDVFGSREFAAANFARFYRTRPSPAAEAHSEDGPLLVITAVDATPYYERRVTTHGSVTVSTRFFDVAQQYRAWVGAARVHGSTSAREGARDLMLLLGADPETHLRENPGPWNGHIDIIRRDLTGARGWSTPSELFHALNHTVRYVVMRNFEDLPDCLHVGTHEDVDMLTGDYAETIRVMNARLNVRCLPRWGGPYWVNISGEDMWFDVRFVGDDYYDPRWADEILDRRAWNDKGFYAPSTEDYFETLAYHAIVHKREFADDYKPRLTAMAAALGRPGWEAAALDDPTTRKRLLDGIVQQHGYRYCRPRDVNVFYNFAATGHALPSVRRKVAGLVRKGLRIAYRVRQPLDDRYWEARETLRAKAPWLDAIIGPTQPG
jgi:hypothetical protein